MTGVLGVLDLRVRPFGGADWLGWALGFLGHCSSRRSRWDRGCQGRAHGGLGGGVVGVTTMFLAYQQRHGASIRGLQLGANHAFNPSTTYPIVSLLINYPTIGLDIFGSVKGVHTELDYRLLVADLVLYGLRPFAYVLLACNDPSFVRAVQDIQGINVPTSESSGETDTMSRPQFASQRPTDFTFPGELVINLELQTVWHGDDISMDKPGKHDMFIHEESGISTGRLAAKADARRTLTDSEWDDKTFEQVSNYWHVTSQVLRPCMSESRRVRKHDSNTATNLKALFSPNFPPSISEYECTKGVRVSTLVSNHIETTLTFAPGGFPWASTLIFRDVNHQCLFKGVFLTLSIRKDFPTKGVPALTPEAEGRILASFPGGEQPHFHSSIRPQLALNNDEDSSSERDSDEEVEAWEASIEESIQREAISVEDVDFPLSVVEIPKASTCSPTIVVSKAETVSAVVDQLSRMTLSEKDTSSTSSTVLGPKLDTAVIRPSSKRTVLKNPLGDGRRQRPQTHGKAVDSDEDYKTSDYADLATTGTTTGGVRRSARLKGNVAEDSVSDVAGSANARTNKPQMEAPLDNSTNTSTKLRLIDLGLYGLAYITEINLILSYREVCHGYAIGTDIQFDAVLKATLHAQHLDWNKMVDCGDRQNSLGLWKACFADFYANLPNNTPVPGLPIFMGLVCRDCNRGYASRKTFTQHFITIPSTGEKMCAHSEEGTAAKLAQEAARRERVVADKFQNLVVIKVEDPRDTECDGFNSDWEDNLKEQSISVRSPASGTRHGRGHGRGTSIHGRTSRPSSAKLSFSVPKVSPTPIQTFSTHRQKVHWFPIKTDSAAGTIPGTSTLSLEDKLLAKRARLLAYAGAGMQGVTKDSFLDTEGINQYLRAFDGKKIFATCHTTIASNNFPNRLRRKLVMLRDALFEDIETVKSFHPSVRFLFKDCSLRTRPGTDWKANVNETTLRLYFTLQEMLLCAVATHLVHQPILAKDGLSFFEFTEAQASSIRNLVNSLDVDNPELLGEEQKKHATYYMYESLYTLYFPPTSAQFLQSHFASPVIVFLAAMWINNEGTYGEIHDFPPYLAKLQFMMQLIGFHKMLESFKEVEAAEEKLVKVVEVAEEKAVKAVEAAREVIPNVSAAIEDENAVVNSDFILSCEIKDVRPCCAPLDALNDELEDKGKNGTRKWFLSVQAWVALYLREYETTPFATLRAWMHSASHIANHTNRRAMISILDDEKGTVKLGDISFTIEDLRTAVTMELTAFNDIIAKVLHNVDLAKLGLEYDPYSHASKDTGDETTPDYGIFSPLSNPESDKLRKRFLYDGVLSKDDNPNDFDKDKITNWLGDVNQAWRLLYTLAHFLSGPVARGTEEEYFNITNQTGARHHIFMQEYDGHPIMVFRSDYHKNAKQTSLMKEIFCVAPYPLLALIYILTHLIRPIKVLFAPDNFIRPQDWKKLIAEYGRGLYVSMGKRLTSQNMSDCIKEFFIRHFQCPIGLQLFRHLSIFIQCRELSKIPKKDKAKSFVVEAEVMNGHTWKTGEQTYARIVEMGSSSMSVRGTHIQICLLMHKAWGVESFPPPRS
ncbi:hypothetical protein BDN71DRAFT_1433672 [Pleurotus eryngii]|uniref:Uncharacterized protein n=1 Tax=Pleurotus eryngii TaxID=5323 RepID=A0A9P6DDY4_PLEER|nr:hypothetical protein BDN71DRAFT_1433672 [Pleurotus eryngii]